MGKAIAMMLAAISSGGVLLMRLLLERSQRSSPRLKICLPKWSETQWAA